MDLETLELLRRVLSQLEEPDEDDVGELIWDVKCAIASAEAEREE